MSVGRPVGRRRFELLKIEEKERRTYTGARNEQEQEQEQAQGIGLATYVTSLGEWFIKRMPFVRHIYNASKKMSSSISLAEEGKSPLPDLRRAFYSQKGCGRGRGRGQGEEVLDLQHLLHSSSSLGCSCHHGWVLLFCLLESGSSSVCHLFVIFKMLLSRSVLLFHQIKIPKPSRKLPSLGTPYW